MSHRFACSQVLAQRLDYWQTMATSQSIYHSRLFHALHQHIIGAVQLPQPRQIIGADARVPWRLQHGEFLSLRRWSWLAQNPRSDADLIVSQLIHTSLKTMHPVRTFFHINELPWQPKLFRPVLVQICWICLHFVPYGQHICTRAIGLQYVRTPGTQSVCKYLF